MKNLKTLILLFLGIATMSLAFTSCNSDDDSVPTKEEQLAYQNNMAGSYSGKLSFFAPDAKYTKMEKYATVDASWSVKADSTVSMRFPVYLLDSAINLRSPDTDAARMTKMKELKTAIGKLKASEPPFMTCVYAVPLNSWATNTYIQYQLISNAQKALKVNLNFGGENHDVYFVFSGDGSCTLSTDRFFTFRMQLNTICIDELKDSKMINSSYLNPLYFYATKEELK